MLQVSPGGEREPCRLRGTFSTSSCWPSARTLGRTGGRRRRGMLPRGGAGNSVSISNSTSTFGKVFYVTQSHLEKTFFWYWNDFPLSVQEIDSFTITFMFQRLEWQSDTLPRSPIPISSVPHACKKSVHFEEKYLLHEFLQQFCVSTYMRRNRFL